MDRHRPPDVEDYVETFLLCLHHHHHALATISPKDLRGLIDRGLGLLRRAKIYRDMGAEVRDINRHIVEVAERRVSVTLVTMNTQGNQD